MKGILRKLNKIQEELKAPKNQYNKFGEYKYRSCEDILEAVKPLLSKNKAALLVGDEVVQIGERIYIKATARLFCTESSEQIENSALAREPISRKGMDESQITGTASSYARKYALNGLFCIDDQKDADTDEYRNTTSSKRASGNLISVAQQKLLFAKAKEKNIDQEILRSLLSRYKYDSSSEIKKNDFNKILQELEEV